MSKDSSASNHANRSRTAAGLLLLALLALAAALPAPATAASSNTYVSLGDSYTAGPGILPPDQNPPAGCLRSLKNYPHLVAADRNLALTDVSCSGATTDDMTNSQNVSGGSNPAQFNALKPSTKTVTITIGGNDIGFTQIGETCASGNKNGTPCQDRYVQNGDDQISDRIKDTAPKVAAVIKGIHSRSPAARVDVLTYLPILPDDQPTWTIDNRASGHGCWPTVPITDGDAAYLVAKEKELNAMLATQASANNATLVDAYKAGIGHDACKPPPLPTSQPNDNVRWVEPAAGFAAPLHPNAVGMKGTALVVEKVVK
jgi:lysophospholipase L1-like esterase